MANEPTLSVAEEQIGSPETTQNMQNTAPGESDKATVEAGEESATTAQQVDFTDEEAALAAEHAGLDLGEAAPEEETDRTENPANELAGKTKEELLSIFSKMIEERPIQTLRKEVEALKIAFYKLRRAEVEAARRAFIEAGGAPEEFSSEADPAEARRLAEELAAALP